MSPEITAEQVQRWAERAEDHKQWRRAHNLFAVADQLDADRQEIVMLRKFHRACEWLDDGQCPWCGLGTKHAKDCYWAEVEKQTHA